MTGMPNTWQCHSCMVEVLLAPCQAGCCSSDRMGSAGLHNIACQFKSEGGEP